MSESADGDAYPYVGAAWKDALLSIEQLVAESLGSGAPLSEAVSRSMEILDEARQAVASISYAEAASGDLRS